jgi:hypothetical protein
VSFHALARMFVQAATVAPIQIRLGNSSAQRTT